MIDEQVRANVLRAVDSLKDELVQLLCDIVRIPSVPATPVDSGSSDIAEGVSGETQVNHFLKPVMESFGLETDLWEVEKGRANLVGIWRGQGGGRSLILNGHVDVVPPGPPEKWTVAGPWSGEIIDGKIYGRGSTDMKGGIAAAIIAVKALVKAGYRPKGDVLIQCVVGEEHHETSAGVGAVLERGYRADAAIVCEPSTPPDKLSINTASPGIVVMYIRVIGKATHTSNRHELIRAGGRGAAVGVSAIDKTFLVYQALAKLEEEWGQTKRHPAYIHPGHFVLFPVAIQGGDVTSGYIPDECSMTYIIWYPPQDTPESVAEEIQAHLARLAQTDPWLRENPPEVYVLFSQPAFETSHEEPICKAAAAASEAVFDKPASLYGSAFDCDAGWIRKAGIPTIVVGPGNPELAHGFNECIDIQNVLDAARLYAMTIVEWCGI
ncbi:MAG TPA: ArgE/DapE family deacylase [Dehalococcoidia bacterium]|nr:ArgE/DapE family deacylase [Dehalococcoidia bacterium]